MRKNILLENETARLLYEKAEKLPIIDYHCHLPIKEILEDKEFDNIGELWLSGDHYKWRLMRQAGVAEEYITGHATWPEKFRKYASVVSMAAGNPLYLWSKMELSMYFGIEEELNAESADRIFAEASRVIAEKKLSPRKLILSSNVEYIATTDDPADSLEYHRALREDRSFSCFVAPAFRPDAVLNTAKPGYGEYIAKLADRAGIEITGISSLREALSRRLDEFCQLGCRFADCGIEIFPSSLSSLEEAEAVFRKALKNEALKPLEQEAFVGYMYGFLASEYKKRGVTMQLHVAVKRDANPVLSATVGADTGSDCTGDAVSAKKLTAILGGLESRGILPETIIYTLNPSENAMLSSVCGSFRGVIPGAAWWFCDHKNGIRSMMETMAEESYFPAFLGMLTDSRSFLSYARHDYFRRILCTLVGEWVEKEDFPIATAEKIVERISYRNAYERCGLGGNI